MKRLFLFLCLFASVLGGEQVTVLIDKDSYVLKRPTAAQLIAGNPTLGGGGGGASFPLVDSTAIAANTATPRITLINSGTASNGNQRFSPFIQWQGAYWTGSASLPVYYRLGVITEFNSFGRMVLQKSTDGSTWTDSFSMYGSTGGFEAQSINATSDIGAPLIDSNSLILRGGSSLTFFNSSQGIGRFIVDATINGASDSSLTLNMQSGIRALSMSGDLTVSSSATVSGTNTGDQTISDATITTTDITTNNATSLKHGFLPKLSGSATDFLNGTGAFSVPAGGGDMTLAGVQTVTGAKTFGTIGGTVGKLILAGSTSGSSILNAAAIAGATTITLPNANSTLPIYPQQITYTGPTAARTVTYPDASFTVARTDAANTFTGTQTVGALVATTVNGNTITAGSSTFTGTAAQTYTFPSTTAILARTDAANTFTGASTGTSWTLTTPVFAGGLTASGSGANTFAASTGTFLTSTGANTLNGATTINDATTPSLTTAAGKTNTGFVQINGKTSGALKFLPADATAQTVTVATAAQTTGASTLTIPDMAGAAGTFAFINKVQSWTGAQTFGAITATTLNGNTFTTGTYTLTGTAAKVLNFTNSLTLSGTDSTTMTFPSTSATIARTDAANTFTGTQTIGALVATTVNGHTFTAGSSTFTGTAAQTYTFPATTSTLFSTTTKTDVLQAAMFAADAGASDTYAITLSPAATAYVTGADYWFKANTANTGAATLNVNALGAKTIVKLQGAITTTLADNDIRAGQWVHCVYDGTNMQMMSQLGNSPSASITGTDTFVTFFDGANNPAGDAGFTYNKTTDSATLAGTLTVGSGASTAGALALTQGTTQSTGTTNVTIQAPTSVPTSFIITLPGAVGSTGLVQWTVSGSVATLSPVTTLPSGITLVAPILGTPASGTLTNCTGLPVAGITASTSTALGVGSVELGAASDTTLARVSAGVISVEGVTVDTISATNTLTNKRVTARITTITSSATPTVNTDNCDCVTITALAAAITSMTSSLTGTPVNFDQLEYRIKDDGTPRAITWGASFVAGPTALPTTTVTSKPLHVYFEYDSVQTKWVCISSGSDA